MHLRNQTKRWIEYSTTVTAILTTAEPLPPSAESAANTLADDHHHSLGG